MANTDENYTTYSNFGKAVIVNNFSDKRPLSSEYCKKLEQMLDTFGFTGLYSDRPMVHENLTKADLEKLYETAANENYASYGCVLFIVMSFGKPGLIKCHSSEQLNNTYVAQTNLQEAFQPQKANTLAGKPKIFIIQTIPEPTVSIDKTETTRQPIRIPREADFLAYTCVSNSINDKDGDIFVKSIVEILQEQIQKDSVLEIQELLIEINKKYKERMENNLEDNKDGCYQIPCVCSSLTKKLYLRPI